MPDVLLEQLTHDVKCDLAGCHVALLQLVKNETLDQIVLFEIAFLQIQIFDVGDDVTLQELTQQLVLTAEQIEERR